MEETDKYQGGKQHKNIKSEFFPFTSFSKEPFWAFWKNTKEWSAFFKCYGYTLIMAGFHTYWMSSERKRKYHMDIT